jgi:hypothetical protein
MFALVSSGDSDYFCPAMTKSFRLLEEAGVKYGEPKKQSKTLRISEGAAGYITKEGERRIRSQIDQIDHLWKLHDAIVHGVFSGVDDVDTIVAKIKEWKRAAETTDKKTSASPSTAGGATAGKSPGKKPTHGGSALHVE